MRLRLSDQGLGPIKLLYVTECIELKCDAAGCVELPKVCHTPLLCDTVLIMNLMCRRSPFGECDDLGISSN